MAYFLRLIPAWLWFLVGCLAGGVPQLAFAQTWYAPTAGSVDSPPCGMSECTSAFAAAAATMDQSRRFQGSAADALLYFGGTFPATITVTGQLYGYEGDYLRGTVTVSGSLARVPYSKGGFSGQLAVGVVATTAPSCVAGEEFDPVTGKCKALCPSGKIWDSAAQTCKDPCSQFAGNSYGSTSSYAMLNVATTGGTGNTTFCDGQCAVSGGKVECSATTTGSGDQVVLGETCTVQGPFVHSGKSCTEAGATAGLVGVQTQAPPWWEAGTDAKKCGESGGYWGSVNGVDTCVRKYPGDGTSTKTTTENPGGKTTTTNPDGSTTTTEESTKTTCEGATCTTTKTTTTGGTNPDGSPKTPETSTTTQEKPKADFCQENPQVAGCDGTKKDGSFGGSCGGGYTCTGDAVQCAIAEQAHKVRCEDEARRTEEQGAAQSYLSGFTTEIPQAKVDQALNANGDHDVDVWQQFADAQQAYVQYSQQCIPDFSFSFKGKDYTIDASIVCEIGDYVRIMLHLLAYMAVLAIMDGAFGGSGGRRK